MSVTIRIEADPRFGRVARIENDTADLAVSLDFGPRVLRYAPAGGANLFFNDPAREFHKTGPEMEARYGPGAVWHIFGGHRLWASPEKLPETYFPDNGPVDFEPIENGGIFRQAPQTENGLRMSMEIRMEADCAGVTITHRIENIGEKPQTLAPWALTVLDRGGTLFVPQNRRDTGLLGNRVLALWPYSDMADPRVSFGKDFIILRQDPDIENAFKFGVNNESGAAIYLRDDTVFVKRYEHKPKARYPDFGVSYEAYVNGLFLESESLGPLQNIAPGEAAVHTERWDLRRPGPDADPEAPDFARKLFELCGIEL